MKNRIKERPGVMRLVFALIFVAFASIVSAQTKEVTGTVKDTDGDGAIGAIVKVKGTTIGTATDEDGNYTLQVPEGSEALEVVYDGKTVEMPISGDKVNFDMKAAARPQTAGAAATNGNGGSGKVKEASLFGDDDEVVVIGYQTVKKKDLVATVTSLSGNALKDIPVTSAAEAMQGKMAGVQITTTEGSPDANVKIRIRGGGSVTQNSDPLYIVDGFPVDNINDIPASSIQSVDVLKDASATAIYGARGANGVVNITTKDTKEGRFSVDYSGFVGWKKLAKELDVLDAREYVLMEYERAKIVDRNANNTSEMTKFIKSFGDPNANPGGFQAFLDEWGNNDLHKSTDWQDEIFGRTGFTSNQSITLNGGSKAASYSLSYNRIDDKAIMLGSDYTKNFLQFKLNSKPIDALKISFTARYSETDVTGSGATDAEQKATASSESRLRQTVRYVPVDPYDLEALMTADETAADQDAQSALVRPTTYIQDNYKETTKVTYSYNGSIAWEFLKGFTIKSELGFDKYVNTEYRYYGPTSTRSKNPANAYLAYAKKPVVLTAEGYKDRLRNTNTLVFDKKSNNKKHHFNVLLGEEMIMTTDGTSGNLKGGYEVYGTENYNLPTYVTYENASAYISAGDVVTKAYHIYPYDDNMLSFFGRATYDYLGKYYATFTLRADGSSKFPKGNQWGIFPSVALAWRVTEEPFMMETKNWLSNLKLRLSYGEVGNNNISPNAFNASYSYTPGASYTDYSTSVITDDSGGRLPNPDLTWETTITRNIGVDFGFLKNRLNGTVDVYWNSTKDLLVDYQLSGGAKSQFRNVGSTSNKGVELTLNAILVDTKMAGVDFSFNIGYNKGVVDDLGDEDEFLYSSTWGNGPGTNDFKIKVGQPIGLVYGYVFDGYYTAADFEPTMVGNKWVFKSGVTPVNDKIGFQSSYYGPGMVKYKDIDGNGVIDTNDKTIIGHTVPEITGGFTLSARYWQFDFAANFAYVIGNDVYNANKIEFTSGGFGDNKRFRNMTTDVSYANRWTFIDTNGEFITPDQLDSYNADKGTSFYSPFTSYGQLLHSGMIEDGSFLRLNALTIGFTFPKSWTWLKKAYISNLRVYFSGGNLFCWTNYSGYDPEVDSRRDTPLTPGVDYSAYPKSRTYNVGLNLTFN